MAGSWTTTPAGSRTMMLAILAYSITTGLSAFAYDWLSFALLARWWASPQV